jgi:hypothetical protein
LLGTQAIILRFFFEAAECQNDARQIGDPVLGFCRFPNAVL